MKVVLILFSILSFSSVSATRQTPDLLIIGQDTLYLMSFPLEELKLEHRPFKIAGTSGVSTACRRGYKAVWRIENNTLYLEKILSCRQNSTAEENIIELFQKNGIDFIQYNGMIKADWFSDGFEQYNFSSPYEEDKTFAIEEWDKNERNRDIILGFEKGVLLKNERYD